MNNIKKHLTALLRGDEGLTTVEYAVAGGMIAAVVVTAFLTLGTTAANVITYLSTELLKSPGSGG